MPYEEKQYVCISCRKKRSSVTPLVSQQSNKKSSSARDEGLERGKKRGRKRKELSLHPEKLAIKQEVSYDTSTPSFPTVSDDVKAFDGLDYSKVYKTKEDVGLRPHDRDFIPSRRIFWKRYQKEIKNDLPQTSFNFSNPLQERKNILSVSVTILLVLYYSILILKWTIL